MNECISITSSASISALGNTVEQVTQSYQEKNHCFKWTQFEKFQAWVSHIDKSGKQEIKQLREEHSKYKNLDSSVLYALATARKAIKSSGWTDNNFGINIGSSRGATRLFEYYHKSYLQNSKGIVNTLSSPTTTLGNISSWLAHDLKSNGPNISHSITCSTALHAFINGIAWLKSGMASAFLVGGSEAANTSFTIAQMKALGIYSHRYRKYPSEAMNFLKKENTMVLGEGAAMFCLEKGKKKNAQAVIEGIGYSTEPLMHNTSISSDAQCFQKSMQMALENTPYIEVDVIIMHAPGTIKGDISELKAVEKIFGQKHPFLTGNKWKIGHTLGASGAISIEMALIMLERQTIFNTPFSTGQIKPKKVCKILVNAVGFGGNAVSILLSK